MPRQSCGREEELVGAGKIFELGKWWFPKEFEYLFPGCVFSHGLGELY